MSEACEGGAMIRHVVMFSGGVGSYMAARRVVQRYGKKGVILLFADTRMEDEDLYRFLNEAAEEIGVPLVQIADGRTPWEVFFDEKFLGNSRIDPCSKILKRRLLDKWRDENCDPNSTTIHVGVDWSEIHRMDRLVERVRPWRYEAPMCDPPYLSKQDMIKELGSIKPPRLYDIGFPHNNCGGFCVKAGQAQFALLLEKMPERYRFHEEKEEAIRAYLGKPVTILTEQTGGKKLPLSLRTFRERLERQCNLFDGNAWGGCGCAID